MGVVVAMKTAVCAMFLGSCVVVLEIVTLLGFRRSRRPVR